MKKLIVFTFIVSGLVLSACGQKGTNNGSVGRKSSVNPNGGSSIVNSTQASASGNWGSITNYAQSDVVNFLSMGMTSDQIGNAVGCTTAAGEPCAIKFNIASNGNPMSALALQQTGTGTYAPTSSGVLTVAVYDSLTGNGTSAIAAVLPTLSQGTMTYNGSSGTASVTFTGLSTVTLSGTISGQYFNGTVTYQNGNNANGATAASGTLGQFQTSICYVFSCQ